MAAKAQLLCFYVALGSALGYKFTRYRNYGTSDCTAGSIATAAKAKVLGEYFLVQDVCKPEYDDGVRFPYEKMTCSGGKAVTVVYNTTDKNCVGKGVAVRATPACDCDDDGVCFIAECDVELPAIHERIYQRASDCYNDRNTYHDYRPYDVCIRKLLLDKPWELRVFGDTENMAIEFIASYKNVCVDGRYERHLFPDTPNCTGNITLAPQPPVEAKRAGLKWPALKIGKACSGPIWTHQDASEGGNYIEYESLGSSCPPTLPQISSVKRVMQGMVTMFLLAATMIS